MLDTQRVPVVRWTVDYGDGSRPGEVLIPHSWRQDLPVSCEGPVWYRTTIEVPRGEVNLVFHGVSYAAEVYVEGELLLTHRGIWDGFYVPLNRFAGRAISVEVKVTKNGGPTYPVKETLAGFLPYVFHTFGGLFGTVELVRGAPDLEGPPARSRVRVEGTRLFVDDSPFYLRGLLHWGWYPELGHPNPPEDVIRSEIREIQALGFNTVKFCLWLPPARYLELLREAGMFAWLELPLWAPASDLAVTDELVRIVRQYRRHDNILVWTIGCELGGTVSAESRAVLTQTVRNLTGCPLVKDTSGGTEMYGGDPREYGDFYDFHPYCDLPYFPAVLDSLLPHGRRSQPVLLGEFNDFDVHRDLARMGDEMPYWASNLSELNAQGVRWQYDLPRSLDDSRFALQPTRSGHASLMESSRGMALFVRKTVQELVRARDGISGTVSTGWRDTPISSSGFFDDWGAARFTPEECAAWMSDTVLYLIPARNPAWRNGGNRVGWRDPFNVPAGPVLWRVGVHSSASRSSALVWRLVAEDGAVILCGASSPVSVPALTSQEIGEIFWPSASVGSYRLEVEDGEARNSWPIWVYAPLTSSDRSLWSAFDPDGLLGGLELGSGPSVLATRPPLERPSAGLLLLSGEGTRSAPFWREAAYEFRNPEFWARFPLAERWSRLQAFTGDRVIDGEWLRSYAPDAEVLLNRVDTRTYAESPILVRSGDLFIASLPPGPHIAPLLPLLPLDPAPTSG